MIVDARRTVSLRTLILRRPEREGEPYLLRWDPSGEVIVEPSVQRHAPLGASVRTWSEIPGRVELRVDSVRAPRAPASNPERLDRLVALYEAELRRHAAESKVSPGSVVATIHTSRSFGEMVHAWARDDVGALLLGFPRIARALDGELPRGWLPVYVYSASAAGLRWLPLQPGRPGLALPPTLDEESSLLAELGLEEPDLSADDEGEPDGVVH